MERSGLTRWLLLGLIVFAVITFVPKLLGNGGETKTQPLKPESTELLAKRAPEKLCDVWGPRFRARLGSQGASLAHFELTTAKYQHAGQPIDLSTTPDLELRRQLRFHWRNEAVKPKHGWQVDYDSLDYKLTKSDGKSCEFVYQDPKVRITKTIKSTGRPYELDAEAVVENLADKKLSHALTVGTDEWRTNAEVSGHMFRVSPFVTHVECIPEGGGKAKRLRKEDFEPDDFEGEPFTGPLNPGDWYQAESTGGYGAVSNAYFSHAIVPLASAKAGEPVCQMQIEARWDSTRYDSEKKDPTAGAIYRARLAYEPVTLSPGEKASYSVLTYIGPKERDILAAAGGGKHDLPELIDLGFFSAIAKILVAFLLKVHSVLPNWGLAIILLTVTARTLLFPLSVPSIKSMIKMRELKPELDALTAKYKDDPQGKGVAQMELWRKHNVNPLKGCLPQLASMPVWFALYTTLQTAVELYNIPFLWFPDLSQADPYYVLPFVIGATSFLQQKMMPMQADAAQQKMMMYFMPAMFTVFMLFLPSGLGVYMFTNGVLGIVQQQIVERYVKRTSKPGDGGKSEETDEATEQVGDKKKKLKGKARSVDKLDGRPLFGKGKA